jgi:hypothetical protein
MRSWLRRRQGRQQRKEPPEKLQLLCAVLRERHDPEVVDAGELL